MNWSAASKAHWLYHIYGIVCGPSQYFKYLCMLLFWRNVNSKLCKNGRWFEQMRLVYDASQFAKILHSDDIECSTPNLLSWIQNNCSEFGDISRCKLFTLELHFIIKSDKTETHVTTFQMIRKVFAYYTLFKTITAEWIIIIEREIDQS